MPSANTINMRTTASILLCLLYHDSFVVVDNCSSDPAKFKVSSTHLFEDINTPMGARYQSHDREYQLPNLARETSAALQRVHSRRIWIDVLAEDFVFPFRVMGPLNKSKYLEAIQHFDVKTAFKDDYKPGYFDYSKLSTLAW